MTPMGPLALLPTCDIGDRDPRVAYHRQQFGVANGFGAPESFHRSRPQYDWCTGRYVDAFDPHLHGAAVVDWPDHYGEWCGEMSVGFESQAALVNAPGFVDPQWGGVAVGAHGGGGHGFGGHGFGGGGIGYSGGGLVAEFPTPGAMPGFGWGTYPPYPIWPLYPPLPFDAGVPMDFGDGGF